MKKDAEWGSMTREKIKQIAEERKEGMRNLEKNFSEYSVVTFIPEFHAYIMIR